MSDFWVFGYGSLMWRPEFAHIETRDATLYGAHRSLCVISHVHRGTPDRPGLVLGLDRGGACRGIAFRVAAARRDEVLAYLREREQATMVYQECWRTVRLAPGGKSVSALCYLVDRSHVQYAGVLGIDEQLRLILQGVGRSGANPDYVENTLAHLRAAGIHDARLEAISTALQGALPERSP